MNFNLSRKQTNLRAANCINDIRRLQALYKLLKTSIHGESDRYKADNFKHATKRRLAQKNSNVVIEGCSLE